MNFCVEMIFNEGFSVNEYVAATISSGKRFPSFRDV